MPEDKPNFTVVEICAGAGGQAFGLHQAGFRHQLAVELDENAVKTLTYNFAKLAEEEAAKQARAADKEFKPRYKFEGDRVLDVSSGKEIDPKEVGVSRGDVADTENTWNPDEHVEVDLLAGGVPCPPFTIAGKQLGANDERDLFAWAVQLVKTIRPRALLLENVRGLSLPRFAGYRQHVIDFLTEEKYVAEWRLLHASDFGVPQLRPRFILVALKEEDAQFFKWPEPAEEAPPTVGESLLTFMKKNDWKGAEEWAAVANKIAPTVVGGSKKHGGADLGPTRAKEAWRHLGVDALGLANDAPGPDDEYNYETERGPKLTVDMVARLQGFPSNEEWRITGKKTSRYRQIGNAFPPPMAQAIGKAIIEAFNTNEGETFAREPIEHDLVYKALRNAGGEPVPAEDLQKLSPDYTEISRLEYKIGLLSRDFEIKTTEGRNGACYALGDFKAFVGQENHSRHESFIKNRAKIS
ncbi:DNA cytosine methyltransferase [Amycolatopsis azurea]|uniref:DNA cytosine methyltransferase n=1 Tax=Amycolatopsis azurea TaxID=36819 RepID=UPI00380A49E4